MSGMHPREQFYSLKPSTPRYIHGKTIAVDQDGEYFIEYRPQSMRRFTRDEFSTPVLHLTYLTESQLQQ